MLKVGALKETVPGECRVAIVPETAVPMIKAELEVLVQAGAGLKSFIEDKQYQTSGAKIISEDKELLNQADIILKVHRPLADDKNHFAEIAAMKEKAILIAPLFTQQNPALLTALQSRKITAFALDSLPRIARAQSMDILSSMSNLAGYKSVIIAAQYLSKIFPMMTTAAGTIPPAKIVVIGAGVAGLQAIATARRLGGVVLGFDTRPATAEQVKSLGAEFVSLEVKHEKAEDASGYAKELSPEFYKNEQEIIRRYLKETDVVITTALIPNKRAPILITEDMVKEMKPGSVIVDLAAAQQGNCTLTVADQIVVKHGVTIVGLLNIPSTVPSNASQLYAKNIFNFLKYILPQISAAEYDSNDEIIKSCLVSLDGKIMQKPQVG